MKEGMRKRLWRWPAIAALGVLLLLLGFFSLPWWLIAQPEIVPSEVILHLSMDDSSKADEYVAELYRRGLARQVVCMSTAISWQVYPADYARQHLIALGVPAERVSTFYIPFVDCRAEALAAIAEFVKRNGWHSALMVVDPVASSRNKHLGQPLFAREQIKLVVTYAPRDRERLLDHWWREHWKTQRLSGEALDSVVDLFYAKCR
jgi:uncharacterized SAM-binding protein YcdF (DUF218 family)